MAELGMLAAYRPAMALHTAVILPRARKRAPFALLNSPQRVLSPERVGRIERPRENVLGPSAVMRDAQSSDFHGLRGQVGMVPRTS